MLLAQFLVLGFTIYVWWAARRDLALRGSQLHGPAVEEWERLQETVNSLIAALEDRATDAEQRVAAAEQRILAAEKRLAGVGAPVAETLDMASDADLAPASPSVEDSPYAETERTAHEDRYAPVYALADAGVTDIAEIVRRTGLGHGEVGMILGLYARRSPR